MARWVHPDRLDDVSASGESVDPSSGADSDDVARALERALVTGGLRRIPRNPRHRDIVLAMLCLNLHRRHPYTELELNDYLRPLLQALHASVDHVTCRRYLVDLGFLKRDRAGTRYLLNHPRLESALSADAVDSARAFLQTALKDDAGS